MSDQWTDRLSDYLDGELDAAERRELDAHLAVCAACTQALLDLRGIVMRASMLDDRPPHADLWPAIAARLDAARPAAGEGVLRVTNHWRGRRITFGLPQLAAAAAVLIAVTAAGTLWLVAPQADPAAVPPTTGITPVANVYAIDLADEEYQAAVADLERVLRESRGKLDPETVRVFEHNLQIIDRAIDDARRALSREPGDMDLGHHLIQARRRKLDVLRQAAAVATDAM